VPDVLPGQRRLPGDVVAFGEIGEVREGIDVVPHSGQRVAAVETDAVRETFLGLERGAVIVRRPCVRLDEEIADLRVGAPSEDWLAGGQRAVLKRVQVSRS
jgi:hypothetical protein